MRRGSQGGPVGKPSTGHDSCIPELRLTLQVRRSAFPHLQSQEDVAPEPLDGQFLTLYLWFGG